MFSKRILFGTLIGLGFLIASVSGIAVAQMPLLKDKTRSMTAENNLSSSDQITLFQRIEQPLELKGAVTLGGLALIGLELWWFLFSRTKAAQAQAKQGIQETTITVDGGYEPNRVVVKVGKPVRLNFLRRDPSSCLEKVLLPDFHIAQELALNHITPVEFTPEKPGKYPFTCGMNMFRGVVEVHSSGASNS